MVLYKYEYIMYFCLYFSICYVFSVLSIWPRFITFQLEIEMQLSGQFLKYFSDSCILTRLHLTDWVRGMLVFTNLKANINFFSVAFYLSFFSLAFIAVYWMLSKKGPSTNYWNYFYFCKITILRMYLVNISRRHLTPTTYCVFSIILYQWRLLLLQELQVSL